MLLGKRVLTTFPTFDIMGEFAFGESFHCLDKAESHLFVRILFDGVDFSSAMGQLERYKVWTIMRALLPKSTFKIVDELDDMVSSLSKKRQARGHVSGDTDMFNYLLQNKGEDAFSQKEYEGNALTLLFAGADTTATVMIFGSYLLCKNPKVMKRVQEEVRSRFRESGEINATNTSELKYMAAVLSEIMRLYPPGPNGLARIISSEAGQSVAGHHVPHGVSVHISKSVVISLTLAKQTSCAVYQLAANRLDVNFSRASEFLPARWFDDAPAEFLSDRKDIYQPFSYGPRNCIGKP
jgi:cytochrome P450